MDPPTPQVGRGPAPHPRRQHGHITASTCCPRCGAMTHLYPPLAWQPPLCEGPRPKGLHPSGGSRQWPAYPQPGQESGVSSQTLQKQFCSSLLPSPPKEAAEILLSPVLLHLSCKNRKNPTVLTETSPASESIFPASAGKKKKFKISSRAWGGTQGEKRAQSASLPLTWAFSQPSWPPTLKGLGMQHWEMMLPGSLQTTLAQILPGGSCPRAESHSPWQRLPPRLEGAEPQAPRGSHCSSRDRARAGPSPPNPARERQGCRCPRPRGGKQGRATQPF